MSKKERERDLWRVRARAAIVCSVVSLLVPSLYFSPHPFVILLSSFTSFCPCLGESLPPSFHWSLSIVVALRLGCLFLPSEDYSCCATLLAGCCAGVVVLSFLFGSTDASRRENPSLSPLSSWISRWRRRRGFDPRNPFFFLLRSLRLFFVVSSLRPDIVPSLLCSRSC